jgi:hypothetical protein
MRDAFEHRADARLWVNCDESGDATHIGSLYAIGHARRLPPRLLPEDNACADY